jgi:murein DD-endopeptidase MepM/ murein hydrolase activator NlpD
MVARRYTVVVADRSTGKVRRVTVALRPAVAVLVAVVGLPMAIGVSARWSAYSQIQQLRATATELELENSSYRTATGELTRQITSLQSAIADLTERSALDPSVTAALSRLPAMVKTQAMGGGDAVADAWLGPDGSTGPEDTFGVLRDLLGTLEGRLQFVRTGVERRQALAESTPSIWPAQGWLSSAYGRRTDPFTGQADFHPALDISTDYGKPIYATANGTVQVASRSGAYGNLVQLSHGFDLTTRYGHMSRFAVKVGDQVKRGDVIGYVGATGRASGAHVHYEVWVNGRPINPLKLLASK